MRKLLRIFKRKSRHEGDGLKYYSFRVIPLINWQMCQDGDIRYCRKGYEPNEEVKDPVVESDVLHWIALQDEYMKRFTGNKKVFSELLRLQVKLANVQLEYLKSPIEKRILINDVNMLEEQIRILTDNIDNTTVSIDELRVMVGKHQGYHITDSMTAYQFFSIVETIEKMNKDGKGN